MSFESPPGYDPQWHTPVGPTPHTGQRKAARAVWVTSGVLLLCSLCCVGGMTLFLITPLSTLKASDEAGQVTAEQWEQIAQLQSQPGVGLILGIVTLLVVLPSAWLLTLGFGVRDGKPNAAKTAGRITLGLTILFGAITAMSLPGLLTMGPAGVINLLPNIALLAMLLWCMKSLKQVNDAPTASHPVSPDDDPWEHSL